MSTVKPLCLFDGHSQIGQGQSKILAAIITKYGQDLTTLVNTNASAQM